MKTLFIADLHLLPDDKKSALFIKFCRTVQAEQLFILGDLFEVWLGDDISIRTYGRIISALRQLALRCKIYLLVGNRDFLIGRRFREQTAITLIDEPYQICLGGENYLLLHGDVLCTEDKSYQYFRRIIRNRISIKLLKSLNIGLRSQLAAWLRKQSRRAAKKKSNAITDVKQLSVERLMAGYANTHLIHGHTHRRNIHEEKGYRRFVLGDWHEASGNALLIDNKQAPKWLEIR